MPRYSRSEKYKNIHAQIEMDNETHINTRNKELAPYSDRLATIEPKIITQNPVTSLDQTLTRLNEVLDKQVGSNPVGSRETQVQTTQSIPYPQSETQTAAPGFPSFNQRKVPQEEPSLMAEQFSASSNMPQTVSDKKPMTAEDIKNEIDMMLRETETRSSSQQDYTDPLIMKTEEIRRELDEQREDLDTVNINMKQTHQIINSILWVVIFALSVILIAIVYFIIKKPGSV